MATGATMCRATPKRSLAERLQMGLGVARGMAALEENDPPIVHRDLKPSNIFIDAGSSCFRLLLQSSSVLLFDCGS